MPVKKSTSPIEEDVTVAKLRNGNCNVYYEKSVTKNMGDYNSAKITVGVTLPICPTKDEIAVIEKTIETADSIVTDEIEMQVSELLKEA